MAIFENRIQKFSHTVIEESKLLQILTTSGRTEKFDQVRSLHLWNYR